MAIESVEIDDNRIIVYTTNDVQGDCNFTIGWSTPNLITTNVNGSPMMIRQRAYQWTLDTTHISGSVTDENTISGTGTSLGVNVHQIMHLRNVIEDENTIDSELENAGITIHPIIDIIKVIEEENEITASAESLNVDVVQIGEIPI